MEGQKCHNMPVYFARFFVKTGEYSHEYTDLRKNTREYTRECSRVFLYDNGPLLLISIANKVNVSVTNQ